MGQWIPVRWIIGILGMYACGLVYTQRSAMSVAIVSMTTSRSSSRSRSTSLALKLATNNTNDCIDHNRLYHVRSIFEEYADADDNGPEFDWSAKLQGVILGSQFYLYTFMPTIAGRMTDIFGGKWIAFGGAFVPFVLSLLTPIITRWGGAPALIVLRTVMGGFHACVYVSMFSLYVRWFTNPRERATASAGLMFGGSTGSAVMYIIAGWLCDTKMGWPLVFYANAVLYLPWLAGWWYYCTNDPLDNRLVSSEEYVYIFEQKKLASLNNNNNNNNGNKQSLESPESMPSPAKQQPTQSRRKTPWIKVFTSPIVWCSVLTKMCAGFGYNLLLTKMPSYLDTIFGMPIFNNGAFNALTTFLQGLCGFLASPAANWLIKHTPLRSIWVRKLFQSIAMVGPAICLALIPVSGCITALVITLLMGAMLLYGFFTGGEWTIVSDYAPNSAGTVFGFANILSTIAGIVAPYMVGILLDESESDNRLKWNIIFYVTSGIYLVGAVIFIIGADDVQQEWDKLPPLPSSTSNDINNNNNNNNNNGVDGEKINR